MFRKFLRTLSNYHTSTPKKNKHFYQYLTPISFHSNKNSTRNNLMDGTIATTNDNDMRIKAHGICSNHLGGVWKDISPNEILFMPISGGMSNAIYCCSLPESILPSDSEVPSQVLLRLYGDSNGNCDISMQLEIFKMLSMRNLGPKLYGQFDDGRLEEFLPATSLTCNELMDTDISIIIAKKLAVVHSLEVPMNKSSSWILDKLGEWSDFIKNNVKIPTISEHIDQSTVDIAKELLRVDFQKEINFITHLLYNSQSPIVFSHNDLHQGNILLTKPTKLRPSLEERLFIIDFEYSSYNYRAYDIANHFSEWCFEYDTPEYPHFKFYEQRFPTYDAQIAFIRSYSAQSHLSKRLLPCETIKTKPSNVMKNHCDNISIVNTGCTNGNTEIAHERISEEVILLEEIRPFSMVCCFLWMLWSIKTSHNSNIKFGYWEHANARWKFYLKFKDSYLAATKSGNYSMNSN